MVRDFEDKLAAGAMPNGAEAQPRSPAMIRKIRVSLSSLISDAQERGMVARNVVRDLRSTRRRGAERRAERRQKGKLKIGSISSKIVGAAFAATRRNCGRKRDSGSGSEAMRLSSCSCDSSGSECDGSGQ